MKSKSLLLAFSTALVVFVGTAQADPSKNTAVYVKGHALDLDKKEVSIDVAFLNPLNKIESEKYGFLVAQTWDDREKISGGSIFVVVKKEDLKKTLDKFGVAPDIENKGRVNRDMDTRKLSGILKMTAKKRPFIDAAGGDVDAGDLPKLPEEVESKVSPVKGKTAPKRPVKRPVKKPVKKAVKKVLKK